jgi:hypothetical protein
LQQPGLRPAAERQYRWADQVIASRLFFSGLVIGVLAGSARAESTRALSPGALVFYRSAQSPVGYGAELSYWFNLDGDIAFAAVAGVTDRTVSAEAQASITTLAPFVAGVDVGPLFEFRRSSPGIQGTIWCAFTGVRHDVPPIPLFPFARIESVGGGDIVGSVGVMLKVPIVLEP